MKVHSVPSRTWQPYDTVQEVVQMDVDQQQEQQEAWLWVCWRLGPWAW